MRRILLLLSLIALAVGFQACAADAPAPTPPGGNGNTTNSALQVRLFTSNANPTAGVCSTIQAIVTLNGVNVPDGTGVIFSTDFGTFEQNNLALVSVVTTNGSALTALCSTTVGVAKVKASVTSATTPRPRPSAFRSSLRRRPFLSLPSAPRATARTPAARRSRSRAAASSATPRRRAFSSRPWASRGKAWCSRLRRRR